MSVTELGNPRKPVGEAGKLMLSRMNDSHAPLTSWALSYFDFTDGDAILDIGCGGGAALAGISRRAPQARLYGVDYSPVSVELTKANNAADVASGKLTVTEASVSALPFCDCTFDKILTVESFYFWPDPQNDLCEVLRVLKRGGTFVLAADVYEKSSLSETARETIEKYNLYTPTEDGFRRLLERAGFSYVSVHTKDDSDMICVVGVK